MFYFTISDLIIQRYCFYFHKTISLPPYISSTIIISSGEDLKLKLKHENQNLRSNFKFSFSLSHTHATLAKVIFTLSPIFIKIISYRSTQNISSNSILLSLNYFFLHPVFLGPLMQDHFWGFVYQWPLTLAKNDIFSFSLIFQIIHFCKVQLHIMCAYKIWADPLKLFKSLKFSIYFKAMKTVHFNIVIVYKISTTTGEQNIWRTKVFFNEWVL